MKYTKEELEVLVNALISADPFKAKMGFIEQGRFLDIFVNDADVYIRIAVAEKGYGLDILIKDEDPCVRRAVAEQGYGLDILINDKRRFVSGVALEKLQEFAEHGEKMTVENIIENAKEQVAAKNEIVMMKNVFEQEKE
jgi:hypothetical protein